ncbi:MAG: hypothetical protein LBB49_06560 [Gracilibacteraceae bacterium]|nr:hypothetical protein [Gracilibacteraceae bacterium]
MVIIRSIHIGNRARRWCWVPMILLGCLLFIGVIAGFAFRTQKPDESSVVKLDEAVEFELAERSLLLGSGLVSCQTANVRYVLWMGIDGIDFDHDGLVAALGTVDSALVWQRDFLVNGWGEHALCFWAEEAVDAGGERLVPGKRKALEGVLRQFGLCSKERQKFAVYLEESVDEMISLQEYWSQENISLKQTCYDGTVESWSGLAPKGLKPRNSGDDLVNVQLTTRKLSEGGKTILAFPALYNDI